MGIYICCGHVYVAMECDRLTPSPTGVDCRFPRCSRSIHLLAPPRPPLRLKPHARICVSPHPLDMAQRMLRRNILEYYCRSRHFARYEEDWCECAVREGQRLCGGYRLGGKLWVSFVSPSATAITLYLPSIKRVSSFFL